MFARDYLLTYKILKLTLYSKGNNYWLVLFFVYFQNREPKKCGISFNGEQYVESKGIKKQTNLLD